MKRCLIFLAAMLVFIAPLLALVAFPFIRGMSLEGCLDARHPNPTAAVLDLRTIGSACTMQDLSDYDTGILYEWQDRQGGLCATLHLEVDRFRTTFPSQMQEGFFPHEEDAVQWIESQPYRAGR